jgi:hypothetical protein
MFDSWCSLTGLVNVILYTLHIDGLDVYRDLMACGDVRAQPRGLLTFASFSFNEIYIRIQYTLHIDGLGLCAAQLPPDSHGHEISLNQLLLYISFGL